MTLEAGPVCGVADSGSGNSDREQQHDPERDGAAATGDYVESVARGLAASGRVITCGALIMMAVFLSFVVNPNPFVKMIGLGLAVAIALDATVVRMILVPATMALLGRANWWLPGWLDR